MFSYKSLYFVVFNLVLWGSLAEISDKRLCVDESCSTPVGVGKTLLRYRSTENNVLSFAPNEDITIFSYGAGTKPNLIGVEINGKRGYVYKDKVKETRLINRPKLLVDTELNKGKPQVPLEGAAGDIKADPTQQPFEIVDGTRIPIDLVKASTEIPIPDNINKESDEKLTTPLEPDNQNNNEPSEPIGSINNNKIEETALPDKGLEDDDDDDTDDEDEDGYDVEDEDEETDEDIQEEKVEEASKQYDPSNTTHQSLPSLSDSHDKPAELLENVTNSSADNIEAMGNAKRESENKETFPIDNIDLQTTEGNKSENAILIEQNEIATKDITTPYLNSTESTKQELEEVETKTNVPVLSEPNLISVETSSEPSVNAFTTQPTHYKDQTASFSASAESIPADKIEEKAKEAEVIVDSKENKEALLSKSDSNLLASTEVPMDIDIIPPVDIYSVTPNPLDSKNEEQTDPVGTEDSPLKESAIEGIAGGLGDLLPLFNTVNVHDDVVGGSNSAEETKSTLEEFSEKDTLEPAKTSANSAISDTHNETENEQSGSFLSGIASFFGMGNDNKENDTVPDESTKLITEDLPADNLDTLKADVINEEENPGEHSPWSFEAVGDQVMEKTENCDSKSEMCPQIAKQGFCDKEKEDCPQLQEESTAHYGGKFAKSFNSEDLQEMAIEAFNSDMFLYLFTTSASVLVLIFVWILVEKCRREAPLIARINKLEQQLLATSKENEMLQEKASLFVEEKTQLVVETVPNEVVNELNSKLAEMAQVKTALEEQIQALEKELDTSTEVGIELNKIISEMLNSTDGSEILKENVEQMQKRLLEQQDTINSLNESSNLISTENYELRLELEISNKKVADLQREVDKMVEKILRIEEERDQQHKILENEIAVYKNKCKEALSQEHALQSEMMTLNKQVAELQRTAETKVKEYDMLKETLKSLKSLKNDKDALKSFLEVSEVKAQLEQMKSENLKYSEQLSKEREKNLSYNTQVQSLLQEVKELRDKYEKADKEKVETNTKLEVLNNYFKEKEDQMQKEISKYESLWIVKEGEATSTTERIRYMQEELQNYKTQNESLKQEIVNQEVELKSQISMLEKKSHESWVTNRQTERKLEEARQEAALLRNRLTMRERTMPEGNNQIRMQSPLHQNGELPISPPPIDPTKSPPPLFNPRDHITKSPPIPGMPPPPFLPPPLGATFMPPPPLEGMMPSPLSDMGGMPPFIPGFHPGMFPGDHRPPPLGRMSSPPPVGGRYSPESTVYSEYDRYDRRSQSPPYDSEYGASPPPIRGYSPYDDRDRDRARLRDDRREYKRSQPRSNGRSSKGIHSSESENDSLGKTNKKPQRKV